MTRDAPAASDTLHVAEDPRGGCKVLHLLTCRVVCTLNHMNSLGWWLIPQFPALRKFLRTYTVLAPERSSSKLPPLLPFPETIEMHSLQDYELVELYGRSQDVCILEAGAPKPSGQRRSRTTESCVCTTHPVPYQTPSPESHRASPVLKHPLVVSHASMHGVNQGWGGVSKGTTSPPRQPIVLWQAVGACPGS
jgi:hypothetical protein